MTGSGAGVYDEISRTWHMTAVNHTPWGQSSMKGKLRFLDDNTTEWSCTEYMGLQKIMEMSGKSKRVQ